MNIIHKHALSLMISRRYRLSPLRSSSPFMCSSLTSLLCVGVCPLCVCVVYGYSYYLRTLEWGAVARSYPKAYSVHQADESAAGGYRLLTSSSKLPDADTLEEIYEENNGGGGNGDGGSGNGFMDGFTKFVKGFQSI